MGSTGAGVTGQGELNGQSPEDFLDVLTVLVIEARPLIRECLLSYMEHCARIRAFGSASWEEYATRAMAASLPDIVLLCAGDGEQMSKIQPQSFSLDGGAQPIPVVVLSDDRPAGVILELLKAGIRGFIPTSIGMGVAIQVLRLVHSGGTFLPESCLRSLAEREDNPAKHAALFTHRQLQVVEAIRKGKPNKIIAYELNMCESTVKVHVRTIMKKLRARNRTQVAYLYPVNSDSPGSGSADGH